MADAIDDELIKALEEAKLQLEYLDERFPTGTTPAVIIKIGEALSRHKAPPSVECKHRPSECDMLGTCMDCGATLPLSVAGDDVERLIEARKVVAKEYRRLGLNPNPVLRGDFDAGVEVRAALRSQSNKVSKPL